MKETIGILGGTFSPVHIGHIALASYMVQWKYVDRVWLVLSPLNPLKQESDILPDALRMEMLEKAAHDIDGVEPCNIELSMPRPSYTIDTLRKLAVTYPDKNFKLIIGSDNWLIFDRWRDHDKILSEFGVLVYPRYGYEITEDKMHERMRQVHAPIFEISSTMIRQGIADGRDIRAFVPKEVYEYIILNKLYKN